MQEQWLPLFPLGVVLFPRTPLPLHIFEERYKEMMGDVIPNRSEFGVVLAHEKGILNVGCTAIVEKVLKRYPDGELDIFTVGRRRFEILLLNEEKAYLRGAVQFFDDEDFETASEELRKRAMEGYQSLRAVAEQQPQQEPELSDPQLSFQIAQLVPDTEFRQALLRTRSEAQRIRQLVDFLPAHLERQRYASQLKQVAPRNGRGRLD